MALDPLDLVQGLGGEVAFTAFRAGHDGHVLDNQQLRTAAVTPCDTPGLRTAPAADITTSRFGRHLSRHTP